MENSKIKEVLLTSEMANVSKEIMNDLDVDKEEKLKIDEERLLFALELENDNTGSQIESKALEEGFTKQNHRHVTILGGPTKKLLKGALAKFSDEERENTLREIKKILASLSWEFTTKGIYKVEKKGVFGDSEGIEHRESYIALIDMPAISDFYARLKEIFNTDFPMQVAHITLFTKGEGQNPRYYGIPISSMEDFQKMNPREFEDNPISYE